jgi:hypothetical protein
MTKSELISHVARVAKVKPSTAARVIEAIVEVEDGVAALDTASRQNGRRRKKAPHLTEAEIRAKLIAGFEKVRGIEIEDVFPGGWSEMLPP